MAPELAVSFVAGFASAISPCVLPLVPGYLSTVSAVEAGRLGEPGAARRVLVGSAPFVAGFLLVVFGLAFLGLIPVPQRLLAPGLLAGARRRGSGALLGAAFATCATACTGPVLASVLVLASDSSTVWQGAVLLTAYSAGLAAAFVLAGVSFARAMSAFRWLRDRYQLISAAGGAVLVAFGLLLFFDRFWWLRVGANRLLDPIGLGV